MVNTNSLNSALVLNIFKKRAYFLYLLNAIQEFTVNRFSELEMNRQDEWNMKILRGNDN